MKRKKYGNQMAADTQARNDGLTLSRSDVFAKRLSALPGSGAGDGGLFFVKSG